jgi:hypothetical protein
MSKIKTNSLFEASIDSFRYRIPLSKVEVINSNVLDEMLHVKLNAVTGEVLKETRATSQWLEMPQQGYEIGFSKSSQFGCEFAVIKISSKLLEYRYLEGIKMQNIELVYNKIMSCNVFKMSFETFLSEGLVTDIDLKKDVELTKDEFKKGIRELEKYSKPKKKKKQGVNTFANRNNLGIEWNARETADANNPFIKIYCKELEAGHKDAMQSRKDQVPFFDTYVDTDELKNRIRIEATLKDKTTAKRYGINVNELTLLEVLKISPDQLNQVITQSLNANLEKRIPEARKPKTTMTPADLIHFGYLNYLIEHQQYDVETAIEYILSGFTPDYDPKAKSRTKAKLNQIYAEHIEVHKYAKRAVRLNSFFSQIGWA